jgi:FtsP/CotA-like multicopper oxidase with cupredoxin domain
MAIQEHDRATVEQANNAAQPTSDPKKVTVVTVPYKITETPWWRGSTSPLVISILSIMVMIALISFSIGSSVTVSSGSKASTSSSSSSDTSSSSGTSMSNSATTPTTANVPNATQSFGNQPAKYVIDKDGAKHFTLTAQQVMWEPVKGKRVLAWTLDGTVPGPVIHATAGDHIRITLINHLPQATSMHWHGLEVPAAQDGVPGVGQKPIEPGQSYTYDFTLHDEDAGTHWYHSHDNDITQVMGGFYGAFLVDPRPGSPQAKIEPKSDVEYIEMISELGAYYVINGKSFPDTQPINLKHGQTVRLRIIGASEMMHPMHLHGGFFNIVAEDGHTLQTPIQKDTLQVAPGETYDLTFYGWAAPGSIYPFHCHILSHLMNPGQSASEMGGLIALVEYAK